MCYRERQEREEAEKAGRQIKEESEDADMTNPFQPINHIVAEVSALLVSIVDNLNSFPYDTCVKAQFCPGLFLKNENRLIKEMEATKKGEEAVQDGVPEPKSKPEDEEDEEDEEEESERQTPESPESGQYLFSVIAPSVD